MDTHDWTYGCEFEFADWDTRKGWGTEFHRDPETAICNTNGIATDPRLISYPFGGEVCTPPTSDAQGQVCYLRKFLEMHPEAAITHRAGLQVHIRVPGLIDDVQSLKRIQKYVSENHQVYPLVDPLPLPSHFEFSKHSEWKAAKKRQHWMRMSHWTVIPYYRVEKQMQAKTTKEFLELAVPKDKQGKPLWHAQPRAAVNLRQLLQTDTIEFRFWSATKHENELNNAICFCHDFLVDALGKQYGAVAIFQDKYVHRKFPKTARFMGWRESRWEATSITKHKRPVIEKNIKKILEGTFDDGPSNFPYLIP
jgi:hypothetical protein